jgi:hypothetical protein
MMELLRCQLATVQKKPNRVLILRVHHVSAAVKRRTGEKELKNPMQLRVIAKHKVIQECSQGHRLLSTDSEFISVVELPELRETQTPVAQKLQITGSRQN